MAVRDDVRQLATKKAQAFTGLTPVAPNPAYAFQNPGQKPHRPKSDPTTGGMGGGYFTGKTPVVQSGANTLRGMQGTSGFSGPVESIQRVNELTEDVAGYANENVVQPIWQMPKAFDPTSGLSTSQRMSTGIGGAMALADVITPFVPEGSVVNWGRNRLARAMAENAPESTFEYGIHHSLTPGIKTIRPSRATGQVTALDARPGSTYFWATEGPDASAALKESVGFQIPRAVGNRAEWIAEPPEFYTASPRIYVSRVPKAGIVPDENVPGSIARRIEAPLRSVREIDPTAGYDQMIEQLRRAGLRAPGFTREAYDKAMQNLARSQQALEQQRQLILRDMGIVDVPVQPPTLTPNPTFTPSPQLLATKNLSDDERAASFLYRSGTPPADIKAKVAQEAENMDQLMANSKQRLIQAMAERIVRKRRGYGVTPSNEIFPEP